MATSLDAFKRLLMQVPKIDVGDDFQASKVYDYYLTREQCNDVEIFYKAKFDCMLSKVAKRQDRYNELYCKFKEITWNLNEIFRIKNPN